MNVIDRGLSVLNYKILLGEASSAEDFDIMLMVGYKNMAAQRQATAKRGEIRDILGTKTMREVTLK